MTKCTFIKTDYGFKISEKLIIIERFGKKHFKFANKCIYFFVINRTVYNLIK